MAGLGEWRQEFEGRIGDLRDGVAELQIGLVEARAELALYVAVESLEDGARLELDGRRPHWREKPTSEQVTDRGGDGQYVYLYWRHGEGPRPRGPGTRAQRKTYVGSRVERIALARRMVANRETQRRLTGAVTQAERELERVIGALAGLASNSHMISSRLRQGVMRDRDGG